MPGGPGKRKITMSLYRTARPRSSTFPFCRLHRIRLVDALPPKCPYRAAFRVDVLNDLQDAAWARLARADPSGLDLLRKLDICSSCRLSRHVLERLRPNAETPAPPPARQTPNTQLVTMQVVRRRGP